MRTDLPQGDYTELTARDGFVVRAFVAPPAGAPRGALVLLQQMDQRTPAWHASGNPRNKPSTPAGKPGVNALARQMAAKFAAAGYLVVAPSTFSRGQSGADYGYRFEETPWSLKLVRPLDPLDSESVMRDVDAAIAHARRLAPFCRVGVVGYCWGGLLAWRAAAASDEIDAVVAYYGGGMDTPREAQRTARCPALVHFPNDGRWMSNEGVKGFIAAQASGQVRSLVHRAAYGFLQPDSNAYDEAAARQAHQLTLDFLEAALVRGDQASAMAACMGVSSASTASIGNAGA